MKSANPFKGNRKLLAAIVFVSFLIVGIVSISWYFLNKEGPESEVATEERSAEELLAELLEGSEVPLPLNADVVQGELDNGLRYYIDKNNRPGSQAEIHLVVNAGSTQESEGQEGAAHFLEHMMFNGTEKYPENELVQTLEQFGAKFGPEVNAYTSSDETVYQLTVPNDRDAVETGLDVLHQWATAATIDLAEVEKERGVILSEWRFRTQGPEGRYYSAVLGSLFAGTPYENPPISTKEAITTIEAEQLRAYYENWYRPQNMAVVVVGDITPSDLEEQIKEKFKDLENSEAAPERQEYKIPIPEKPLFKTFVDGEISTSNIEVNFLSETFITDTGSKVKVALAQSLLMDILYQRLSADAQEDGSPFYEVFEAANPYARNLETAGFVVTAESENLDQAAEALFIEIERLKQFGVTEEELERSTLVISESIETAYDQRETQQDLDLANAYVRHFLVGEPFLDPSEEFDIASETLAEIDTDYLSKTIEYNEQSQSFFVIASGKTVEETPSESRLGELWEQAQTKELSKRSEQRNQIDVLLEDSGEGELIRKTEDDILGSTKLEYKNGVTVLYKRHPITEGRVVLQASSPGGFITQDSKDFTAALLAPSAVGGSGFGEYSRTDLEQYLSSSSVEIAPYIEFSEEGFYGSSNADELATLMQLINLLMLEPRVDDAALRSVTAEYTSQLSETSDTPLNALREAASNLQFGSLGWDHSPTVAEIESITAEETLAIYKDRFNNPNDFVFAFTGDIDSEEFEELATKWLGTLPQGEAGDDINSLEVSADTGKGETMILEAGEEAEGNLVRMYTSAEIDAAGADVNLEAVSLVLNLRLTEVLREELGFTYSPHIEIDTLRKPFSQNQTFIFISGDPENHSDLSTALENELEDLRQNGPTEEELETVQEQLLQQYQFTSNEAEAQELIYYELYPEADRAEVIKRFLYAEALDQTMLKSYFVEIFPEKEFFELQQIPRSG